MTSSYQGASSRKAQPSSTSSEISSTSQDICWVRIFAQPWLSYPSVIHILVCFFYVYFYTNLNTTSGNKNELILLCQLMD